MKGATVTSIFLLLAAIQAAMCNMDPKSFFPVENNLTRVVWEHAVNNVAKLQQALQKSEIMMLEADVSMGTLINSTNTTAMPIMAHPPATTSDLSLQDFLKNVTEKKAGKGIKLDFKSIEAFNESKPILDKFYNDFKFPVFINADILPGPVNATTTPPVDAKQFLALAKTFPNCTLSVGWTTRYGAAEKVSEGGYTEQQVEMMIKTLKEQNVSQPITYPVRAGPASNNITVIKSLMEMSANINKNVTLTVWSSEGDEVNVERLSTLIKDLGVNNVYVDVPKDLMVRLNLSSSSSASVASMALLLSMILTVFASTFM